MTSIVCIEDPFKLSHNLTANLKTKLFHRFTEYIRFIAINCKTIFKSEKEDNKSLNNNACVWGISRIITAFDPTLIGYVFAENL